jgi:hypothetical protein
VSFISGAMYSYADLTGPGALGLLGCALDAYPDLRPSRLDTKVPPRRRVDSSAEVMAEVEAAGFAKDLHLWWRDSGAGGEGSLNARQDIWAPQNVYFGIKEDWLRDGEHRELLAAWILGMGDAQDSYVGEVYGTTATNDHLVELVVSHRRRARRADVQLSNGTGSTNESRYLWPHMWLIYLGPSYVHKFGKDKVSRLGVRQDWSANGGALVWNALDPFLHVPDARTSLDYPYVQSWIDALGPNTVIHEEFKTAKQGELLPTRAEHEAATRPVERRYLPGHQPG